MSRPWYGRPTEAVKEKLEDSKRTEENKRMRMQVIGSFNLKQELESPIFHPSLLLSAHFAFTRW
jgi:hypothetical protein